MPTPNYDNAKLMRSEYIANRNMATNECTKGRNWKDKTEFECLKQVESRGEKLPLYSIVLSLVQWSFSDKFRTKFSWSWF